jgi:long-chain acyl-CoA synthetase
MQGYWRRPAESDQALRDGWLHTGDLALMDKEGYFRIINRASDLITVGKRYVYPRDVEEVLYEHPAVREVAALGVSGHGGRGEVCVYVVLRRGQTASKEEIRAFCRERLHSYQVPGLVRFCDQIPRSFVGKVLRHKLVEEELAQDKEDSQGNLSTNNG